MQTRKSSCRVNLKSLIAPPEEQKENVDNFKYIFDGAHINNCVFNINIHQRNYNQQIKRRVIDFFSDEEYTLF